MFKKKPVGRPTFSPPQKNLCCLLNLCVVFQQNIYGTKYGLRHWVFGGTVARIRTAWDKVVCARKRSWRFKPVKHSGNYTSRML